MDRELGYEKPEDHIRDCKMIESKKQKQIIAREEHRLRQVKERNDRLMAFVKGESENLPDEELVRDDKDEVENRVRTLVNTDVDSEKEEEEDEELAMAKAIELEQATSSRSDDKDEKNGSEVTKTEDLQNGDVNNTLSNANGTPDDFTAEDLINDSSEQQSDQSQDGNEDEIIHDSSQNDIRPSDEKDEETDFKTAKASSVNKEGGLKEEVEPIGEVDNASKEEEEEEEESTPKKDDRPRNSAWKAMLEKEKQDIKRRKALRKGQIDDEAEEEEEEEGVAGLEDFGFTVKSNIKEDEEGDNEVDEDDLEHIVDEVSDGEGDEEAGEKARKELLAKEEKLRHKEVLRRIREGYDGKRGGVAGGSSKRGNLRFDQLVAADNKDDARRLGLLNDDELDSDDEDANTPGEEEEDEEVLIDKMLKDRYLNRPDLPEENFSDSEDESNDENDENGKNNEDDEEDREQERLAKRFAKRARMNRLIELHGEDKEFSQTRLLDEDEDLRKELAKIRVSCCIYIGHKQGIRKITHISFNKLFSTVDYPRKGYATNIISIFLIKFWEHK